MKSITKMSQQINEMIDQTFSNMFKEMQDFERLENGSLQLSMDVPGFKQGELSIEVVKHTLTVKGEKKVNNTSRVVFKSITIPNDVDSESIEAKLEDGVLTLTMAPLQVSKEEVKKIAIKS